MFNSGPLGLVEFFGIFVSWVATGALVLTPLLGPSESSDTHAYYMYVTGRRPSLDRYGDEYRGQFATIDLFALVVLMQIPLVLIIKSGIHSGIVRTIMFVLMYIVWSLGLAVLAKHQIVDWRRRFALLVFVMPLGCFGGLAAFLGIWELARQAYPFVNAENQIPTVLAGGAGGLFILAVYVARRTAVWCISPYFRWPL